MIKEITIYELIKLIKEDKAPNRVVYDNKIWDKQEYDYFNDSNPYDESYLFVSMADKNDWLNCKVSAFIENQEDNIEGLTEIKSLNSDSKVYDIEEIRLDIQTIKNRINDIVKVINRGNR